MDSFVQSEIAASKHRSSDGCWTCRLRRKKCDEARPVCAGCATLEIDCLYSDIKPEWMDNGERQKEEADKLKLQVKRKAAQRRERRYYQSIGNGSEDIEMITDSDGEQHVSTRPGARAVSVASSSRMSTAGPATDDSGFDSGYVVSASEPSLSGATPVSSNGGFHAVNAEPSPAPTSTSQDAKEKWRPFTASLSPPRLDQERELSVVMLYLDYVFPFLYPFYRPTLVGFGRGWLLVLLMNNKALFHSALSLTSYFSAIANGSESHTMCRIHNAQEVEKQQDLSLRELQSAVRDLSQRGVKGNLAESARVMASIIQLLVFEVTIAGTSRTGTTWPLHLDAAIALFDQLIRHHSTIEDPDPGPSWCQIMSQLSDHGSLIPHIVHAAPFNADQSALRFYAAVLLHMDVVSSTALCRPPALLSFHAHLLSEVDPSASDPRLSLESFVGVENWVILALGQISALAAWKRDMAAAHKLSLLELVKRAAPIECELRRRLGVAEEHLHVVAPPPATIAASFPFTPAGLPHQPPLLPVTSVTRVWGHAALTYLLVVISGWQPRAADVRDSVSRTRALLQAIPSANCLRTVAWPLCVSGCLAVREEEGAFRSLVTGVGGLEVYGVLREALAIMEAVWRRREEIESVPGGGDWDFEKCFNVLGRRVLMV